MGCRPISWPQWPRAARKKQESAVVLLLPLVICILTVIAAFESPALAAGFRLYAVF